MTYRIKLVLPRIALRGDGSLHGASQCGHAVMRGFSSLEDAKKALEKQYPATYPPSGDLLLGGELTDSFEQYFGEQLADISL